MSEAANDPFELNRFLEAQAGVYQQALAELERGRKQSHWMWFIFPQIIGLGYSPTSLRFAIRNLDEAAAYLMHPILGSRLRECAETLDSAESHTAVEIFGSPDDMKLRSSMTLFEAASDEPIFGEVIKKYFKGERDEKTLQILARQSK